MDIIPYYDIRLPAVVILIKLCTANVNLYTMVIIHYLTSNSNAILNVIHYYKWLSYEVK